MSLSTYPNVPLELDADALPQTKANRKCASAKTADAERSRLLKVCLKTTSDALRIRSCWITSCSTCETKAEQRSESELLLILSHASAAQRCYKRQQCPLPQCKPYSGQKTMRPQGARKSFADPTPSSASERSAGNYVQSRAAHCGAIANVPTSANSSVCESRMAVQHPRRGCGSERHQRHVRELVLEHAELLVV